MKPVPRAGVNGDQTDNSAPVAGAVYVFTRTAGSGLSRPISKPQTLEQTKISAVPWQSREISWPLASRLEDSNATGINGDQGNSTAPDSGAVYLFTRSGGVWTQKAYLKASNSNAGDEFGEVVALSGNTLAVGAYREASNATGVNGNQADNSAPNSGATYVFDGL